MEMVHSSDLEHSASSGWRTVEDCQDLLSGITRPVVQHGGVVEDRARRDEPRPSRALFGTPDGEGLNPSPLFGHPSRVENPTGQDRILDRFPRLTGGFSTRSIRFSIGSKTRKLVPVARSACRTDGSESDPNASSVNFSTAGKLRVR